MTTECTREKLDGVARGSLELTFCLEIRGCPRCGSRDIGYQSLDVWRDQNQHDVVCYVLTCPNCGLGRRVEVFQGPEFNISHPAGHLGGPEPSSIIEPHEFVIELHRALDELSEALAVIPAPGEWVWTFHAAEKCMNELPKFFEDGCDEIPERYFRTTAARDARAAHPEWFRRPYLDELRRRYDAVDQAADREVARRDAAGEKSAPLPPLVAPFSRASIALHQAWLGDQLGGQRLQVKRVDASEKQLSAIDLTGATFDDVTFDRADLSFTRFHGATFTNVRARGAGFASAMLAGTTMTGCDFTVAGMPIANLGDATIEDSAFTGANLERTTWYRSKVSRTSFADSVMHDVGIDKAVFTDCDFSGADLGIVKQGLLGTSMDAVFVRCDLRGTNWAGRELFRVRFEDCKLFGAHGTPRPDETVIERPDLSSGGDGSKIGTDRDVLGLWGIDPDAAPPSPTHRQLVYDVADDEGDYLEEFLKRKGYSVVKRLFRRGSELRFELRVSEPLASPIASMIESQLAKYRYAQEQRRLHPENYVNPDGSPKLYAQLAAEDAIEHADERGESFEDVVQRLLRAGLTVDEAHEVIIDPSKARRGP